jgi:hypothetical protein
MNPRFRLFFLSLLVFLLAASTACAKAAPADRAPSPGAAQSEPAPTTPSADRARIVTVTMGLRVADLDRAMDEIRRDVAASGGYVEGSNLSAGDGGSASMDLRVPADRASATRASLRKLGSVTSESETVQDVTEQRADLGARLRAARAQEDRLLEIMKNKTGSISDVLESEKELARVRENIEKLEAEQRTMEGQIAMATIHLTLATPGSAAWQTPVPSVGRAWHGGVRFAKALTVYGAMAAAAVAPTLAPVLAFLALVTVAVRRRERAKRVAEAASR